MQVAPVVRARAEQLGDGGSAWLAGLDALATDLAERWGLRLGGQLTGGTASVVLSARTADGQDAVVKLSVPDPDQARQVGTLVRAGGRGYARVLAADEDRFAVLLERLGPSLDRSGLDDEAQLAVLCRVLPEAWTVPPAPGQPVLDKAAQLEGLVRELGGPLPPAVREKALACAAARAADPPGRPVVVHGDAAAANCLQAPGHPAGYAMVDPDGFLGDPAYDLGVALRDRGTDLPPAGLAPALRRWARLAAERTGLDPVAVAEWAFLERVTTGLFALSLGAPALAEPFLRTAATLAGAA